ncbi:MAG: hypothetical protein IJ307_02780 [Bacteroidales bacterium]|nr:hypothetical protein [Bacteroidales bacterium]
MITDHNAYNLQFPYSDFQYKDNHIKIAGNRFGRDGINLDIQASDCSARGSIRFGSFTPIQYDIMGPFQYVPFMQCRHSVYSMHHSVDGEIQINGIPYVFQNSIGYIEGDRGHSFPKEYVWTQCSLPDGSLMLSVADIPFCGFRFTGVIGVVFLRGKEYRLATYLGAKPVKITPEEIIIRQDAFSLTIKPQAYSGHPLRAPVDGAMIRTIHEHPSCKVYYCFEENGSPLLTFCAENAAFEYEF